ncbi:hypothetical protein, partial [Peribacillus butanolivorans]|uniref:hypothetical protein n=1 Tax=Peribacillus butanolivorans TaxID=421767 RepID=UPI0036652815
MSEQIVKVPISPVSSLVSCVVRSSLYLKSPQGRGVTGFPLLDTKSHTGFEAVSDILLIKSPMNSKKNWSINVLDPFPLSGEVFSTVNVIHEPLALISAVTVALIGLPPTVPVNKAVHSGSVVPQIQSPQAHPLPAVVVAVVDVVEVVVEVVVVVSVVVVVVSVVVVVVSVVVVVVSVVVVVVSVVVVVVSVVVVVVVSVVVVVVSVVVV